nr:ornithine cyclodeaminase [Ipomoea batatas]
MANLCELRWSEKNLRELGIAITPQLIAEALNDYWSTQAAGCVGNSCSYLPIDKEGRTEAALLAFVGNYSGVKSVQFDPARANLRSPTAEVGITLRNRLTGTLLMTLEGTAISQMITGWLAVECLNLLLRCEGRIKVFIFGTGKIAETVIHALNNGAADRIERIAIFCHDKQSNQELVRKLLPCTAIRLMAVDNRQSLRRSKFIITASEENKPLFDLNEVSDNAVTLALGNSELPVDYFQKLLELKGTVVVDDMEVMERQSTDPLALYYSKRYQTITRQGREDGIRNIHEVHADTDRLSELSSRSGPANFSMASLASYDIAVAGYIYEKLTRASVPQVHAAVSPTMQDTASSRGL